MNYLLAGGSGFVGTYFAKYLTEKGHSVTIMTRSPAKYANSKTGYRYCGWGDELVEELNRTDVLVNLAGENLFGERWNEEVKKRLVASRIETTRKLVEGIAKAGDKPKVFVSSSAVGYYGENGDKELPEGSPPKEDFLSNICVAWEKESEPATQYGVRVVNPRIGVVIEQDGGALEKMLPAFKMFVGGPLGSGKQWFPWIHMQDTIRILEFCATNESLNGPVNCVAPEPVRMSAFTTTLGKVMSRPSFFPVPEFVLSVVVGEAASDIVASQRVIPKVLSDAGFEWLYPDAFSALKDVMSR